MDTETLKIRTKRVRLMNKILHALYPDARVELHHSNTWELLVAVILSAQCTDARVNMVTAQLFKKYICIKDYAKASQRDMERMVYQCGFYRNKAKYIRATAKILIERFDGVVPDTMDELLLLPGVARKTANVVLSNAFQKHEGIAVDTHVRRFAIRFGLTDFTDPERIEKDLVQIMPQKEWWGFNHRLVLYGRYMCPARKHICVDHPLTDIYQPANDIWPKAH